MKHYSSPKDCTMRRQDAYARNFVVTGDRDGKGAAAVDFDFSNSYPTNPGRRLLREKGDWTFFSKYLRWNRKIRFNPGVVLFNQAMIRSTCVTRDGVIGGNLQ